MTNILRVEDLAVEFHTQKGAVHAAHTPSRALGITGSNSNLFGHWPCRTLNSRLPPRLQEEGSR